MLSVDTADSVKIMVELAEPVDLDQLIVDMLRVMPEMRELLLTVVTVVLPVELLAAVEVLVEVLLLEVVLVVTTVPVAVAVVQNPEV